MSNQAVSKCLVLLAASVAINGQAAKIPTKAKVEARVKPAEWKKLVPGGQFKDLFEPMPVRSGLTDATWGGDNVKPRDVLNGIEEADWSYWCGYPIKEAEGKYHLYTARWPEGDKRGHFGYFDSEIVHAVANDPAGPYRFADWIGPGHNPEVYKNARGAYMLYSTDGRFFSSKSLNGPWKRGTYTFDQRGRYAFKNFVNFSFAERSDKSVIAVSRRGYIWASKDGGECWSEVSSESVYPKYPGIFEDPVMWKDDVQYHIIVNDWKGRIAYHLRSFDGFHWKDEPGEAYVPGIARYEDGTKQDWYKFERLRFLQDEFGRPVQAHFAVIDSDKYSDQPHDNHNSKHITIPVTKPKLLSLENTAPITAATGEIRVKIKAEEGFNPQTDMDLKSLRFGDSIEVNYGRAAKVVKTEKSGQDLVLVFNAADSRLKADNWAGKLLGKTADDKILYGWVRLPGTESDVPQLSALLPQFEFSADGLDAFVEVQNFGVAASENAMVKVFLKGKNGDQLLGESAVRGLKSFEKTMVRVPCKSQLKKGSKLTVSVVIEHPGRPAETLTQKVTLPVN